MSWKKASGLLFGEYVCLAILSFPGAFATLGMAGGMLTVLLLGLSTLYTSLTLHKYCLKYPHLLHIADIGKQIFGGSRIAYELTFLALVSGVQCLCEMWRATWCTHTSFPPFPPEDSEQHLSHGTSYLDRG